MIDQIILILTICTLMMYFWSRKSNNRLPPGPMQLPVLGSMIQLHRANPVFPHLALAKLADKYGDVMSFGFGMHSAVVVSSFEVMQDVFKSIHTNSRRFQFPYVVDRNYGKNLGIIWGYDQKWIDVRKFTKKILKEFGYGKPKIMDESLKDSANQLVDYIKAELLDSSENIFQVDPKKFSVHVLNIVWNMAGGYKFDPNDANLLKNMECVEKVDRVFGHSNLYTVFPFLKTWFPDQVNYPEHLQIHNDIHEFTDSLINDAKVKRSERVDSDPTSFIEVFLDKIEEHRNDPNTLFTREQLVIIVEDLFFGALVTTGTLLAWSILFLVLYPSVQAKLRQEIMGKMKNRTDLLQKYELKAIPYVKATILEIMRKGNIAPIPVPRTPTKDIEIGEYLIPKVPAFWYFPYKIPDFKVEYLGSMMSKFDEGSVLFYNLYVMFNDKKFWEDPETFWPERFINENGEIDKMRSERILNAVFGIGPRVCFGETVAIDSLFMFLSAMIINFKFDRVPREELSSDPPENGLVIAPQRFGAKITSLSA